MSLTPQAVAERIARHARYFSTTATSPDAADVFAQTAVWLHGIARSLSMQPPQEAGARLDRYAEILHSHPHPRISALGAFFDAWSVALHPQRDPDTSHTSSLRTPGRAMVTSTAAPTLTATAAIRTVPGVA